MNVNQRMNENVKCIIQSCIDSIHVFLSRKSKTMSFSLSPKVIRIPFQGHQTCQSRLTSWKNGFPPWNVSWKRGRQGADRRSFSKDLRVPSRAPASSTVTSWPLSSGHLSLSSLAFQSTRFIIYTPLCWESFLRHIRNCRRFELIY